MLPDNHQLLHHSFFESYINQEQNEIEKKTGIKSFITHLFSIQEQIVLEDNHQ